MSKRVHVTSLDYGNVMELTIASNTPGDNTIAPTFLLTHAQVQELVNDLWANGFCAEEHP